MHKPQLADHLIGHLIGDRPQLNRQLNLLLLGKDGQLGQELQRALAPLGTLTAWGRETADLAQPARWIDLVLKLRPDVIINAAAYTAVDKAESEPALAHAVNAAAPAALANAAKQLGAHLVHYSTDYVFDGSGQTPWRESDAASPLNVYGASKLAGEQAIIASGCNYWIFRTSWVYAKAGGNFAKTMLRLAAEREYLSVIDDQWGAPTDAAWLADITASALQASALQASALQASALQTNALQTNTLPTAGIYHAVCAGETSWHGYASYLIARARSMGFPIKVLPEAIRAVASTAFPTPAQRPHNSRLDCSQLQTHFGITPPPWQRGIDELLEHLFDQTLSKP